VRSGVVPYDPAWPAVFRSIRARVDAALSDVPHVTEHVGSTAVPGLVAKPIIDVCVVVPTPDLVAGAVAALTRLGYAREGNLGITGREAFRAPQDAPAQHLYVVVAGTQPHLDHVRFRNFLRTQPDHAQRYGARKLELAPLLDTDRLAYVDGKAELVTELLVLAAVGNESTRSDGDAVAP